jgi:hypothetical protein
MSHITLARGIVTAAGAASLVVLSSCTMDNQDPPAFAGPSEYATSLTMTASPDMIVQDGASQSVIGIVARDAANQPIANLSMRVDVVVNGAFANDFGRLSARNITTGSDGRTTVVYTAPPQPPDHNGGHQLRQCPVAVRGDPARPARDDLRAGIAGGAVQLHAIEPAHGAGRLL